MKEYTIIYRNFSSKLSLYQRHFSANRRSTLSTSLRWPYSHSVCLVPGHFRLGPSLYFPILSTWTASYSRAASVTFLHNSYSRVLVSSSTSVLFMHVSSVITSALYGRSCLSFPLSTRDDQRAMTSPFPPPTRVIRLAMTSPFPPSMRDDR